MESKTMIGLEIHVELSTESKMFCGCKNSFGDAPNTHVCEVCLGHPGALPVLNQKAVEYAIMAGLAFDCTIAEKITMDRKKYFYPDLVKGFQISQDENPLCRDGHLDIETAYGPKRVRIRRIHIEEDTGKSIHTQDGQTLMDYNRSGVPLIEIVTEPDMDHPEEGYAFLLSLRERLKNLGISDVKMEEGSLRCDININAVGEDMATKISEIKNLNSFKGALKAMEAEEKRHRKLLEAKEEGAKETRRWDEARMETVLMRSKEAGHDYRYSVEGDIPVIPIPKDFVEGIRKNLPELAHEKAARFVKDYGIDEADAEILSQQSFLADFFEDVCKEISDARFVSNWVLSDLLRRLKETEAFEIPISKEHFVSLLQLVYEKKINNNTGKKLLRELFEKDFDPEEVVKERGLIQIDDDGALVAIVEEVLRENPDSLEDIRNGKDRALGFLVGQAMKKSKGKGNPVKFNAMIRERL